MSATKTANIDPDVFIVHATWLGDALWFWDCRRCECAFGPLSGREGAAQGAHEHITKEHN